MLQCIHPPTIQLVKISRLEAEGLIALKLTPETIDPLLSCFWQPLNFVGEAGRMSSIAVAGTATSCRIALVEKGLQFDTCWAAEEPVLAATAPLLFNRHAYLLN